MFKKPCSVILSPVTGYHDQFFRRINQFFKFVDVFIVCYAIDNINAFQQGINHGIARHHYRILKGSFVQKVFFRSGSGGKMVVGYATGKLPVNFFRKRSQFIIGSQSCFYVSYFGSRIERCQCSCGRSGVYRHAPTRNQVRNLPKQVSSH